MHLKSFCLDVGNREDGIESMTENWRYFRFSLVSFREFKITTTATATGTSLNERFNEQNNGCARAF